MENLVCTLFEKDYHLGGAALINSLCANGFKGTVYCGFRGELPPWAAKATRDAQSVWHLQLTDDIEVLCELVTTPIHLTNYKPTLMLELIARYAPHRIFYLDPDIVVKAPWSYIERWATGGVALCEDMFSNLPAGHPRRLLWSDWMHSNGWTLSSSPQNRHYCAGFVGLEVAQKECLTLWRDVLEKAQSSTDALAYLRSGHPLSVFHNSDQDGLNMVLMLKDFAINASGMEGMDFAPGGHLLSHAAGTPKPWQGHFLRQALHGIPPTLAAREFFRHTTSPIRVFSPLRRAWLVFSMRLACAVGRFYKRA